MKIKLNNTKPIPTTATPDCHKCDKQITGEIYFCNSNYGTNHPVCEECMNVTETVKHVVEIGKAVVSGEVVMNFEYSEN